MRRLIILFLLFVVLPFYAHASIARDGNCSAATTSCTLSAVNTNDLILVFAYRNASTTAPSLPASNTNVFISTGGATNSFRVYCRIASSSSDTGTGTATNATGIVAVAYSGVPTTITANCANQAIAVGVVGTANQQSGSSTTTATYSGLTTSSGAGTSWIVGFMGDTVASDNCTPTGMTIVGSLAGNTQVADTNGTVTSWAQKTCTITSATYRTFTVEVLAADSGAGSGTPTCSNLVDQIEPINPNAGAGYTQFELPHKTGNGNTIIVAWIASPGDTITVTDDKSNSYFADINQLDSVNNQNIWILRAQNIAGSSNPVLQLHHSASEAFSTGFAMECTNVTTANALDVTPVGTNAASNTIASGSQTPATTNDLVFETYWNDYVGPPSTAVSAITAGSQSNITWALAAADRSVAIGGQWGVYASTSALNPTMSQTSSTAGYVAASIFLKRSTAGTAFPSYGSGLSPVVSAMKTFWIATAAPYTTLPRTDQFACDSSNNSIVVEWLGGSGAALSGVTDSNSNSYTQTHAAVCNASGGCAHAYYAQGATVSPSQALTLSGTVTADSAKLYCIQGGATSGFFDTNATNTGDQTVTGNLNALNITPSSGNTNGIIFSNLGVGLGTISGTTGTGQFFTGCFWSLETGSGGGCDENNGWAYYQNSNTSLVNWTWVGNGSANGQWVAWADAFKGPATATTTRRRASVINK